MGYSCTTAALRTLQAVKELNGCDLESSNEFHSHTGRRLFFERGEEKNDGAIVGSVFDLRGKRAGSFRIEGNGYITRFFGLTTSQCDRCVAYGRTGPLAALDRWPVV